MLDPFYGGGYAAVDPQDYSGLETLLAQNVDALRLPAAPATTGTTMPRRRRRRPSPAELARSARQETQPVGGGLLAQSCTLADEPRHEEHAVVRASTSPVIT